MADLEKIDPVLVRIARTLATSHGSDNWRDYLDTAQAVLLAMREPSEAMLEAGAIGMPDWGDLPKGWRAMIDIVIGREQKTFNDNEASQLANKAVG